MTKDGFKPSEIKDRQFFKSIYFREPGGIIIELAAPVSGFNQELMDYEAKKLFLPSHFENQRVQLEATLTPVFVREIDHLETYKYQNKQEYDEWFAHKELLRKINEFARLAKERPLTEAETQVRSDLRKAYVQSVTYGVRNMVNNVHVEDKDGEFKPLEKKENIIS